MSKNNRNSIKAAASEIVKKAKDLAKRERIAIGEALLRVSAKERSIASQILPPFLGFEQDEGWKATKEWTQLLVLHLDLEPILVRLDKCGTLASTRTEWPKEDDLKSMDNLVNMACLALRKNQPKTLWKRYEAVDRKLPHLKVVKRIEGLVKRLVSNVKHRQLETFMAIKTKGGSKGDLANEFLRIFSEIRERKTDPAKVDWTQFEALFLQFRKESKTWKCQTAALKTLKANETGSPALIAYTVFLEIDSEDRRWLSRNRGLSQFIFWINRLISAELVTKTKRFIIDVDGALLLLEDDIGNHPIDLKRAAARNRQSKSRKKKKAAKESGQNV